MGVEDLDQLQTLIDQSKAWPIWNQSGVGGVDFGVYSQAGTFGRSMRDIALWVALRESDRDQVSKIIGWDSDRQDGVSARPYKVDPLPERISQAFADLMFGEDPKIEPGSPEDADALAQMVEANDLPSEVRRWASDCSSEGEIWWKIFVNEDISDYPIIEASSRLDVIPLFRGRRIAAVAFISDLFTDHVMLEGQRSVYEVWRHIEMHTDGMVRNALYKGDLATIGEEVGLDQRPETASLEEEWNHGLDVMLAGRIPNKLGRDWRLGVSDYQGIKDLLLDLNEARVIMGENARLTAKKRMVVPAAALDEDGNFNAGADVLTVESLDTDLDNKGKAGPYAVLEYNFQATQLIQHIDDLTVTALTRVGLAEQFTGGGKSGGGAAFSGTALRTRLIPTTLAAAGKARFFNDALPKILAAMAQVDQMPTEQGGCGHAWREAKNLPIITLSEVLPSDPTENITRHVAAVTGEVESVETAVRELNPEADDEWITDELQRIKDDRQIFGTGPKQPPDAGGNSPPPPGGEGVDNTPPLETPNGPERPTGPLTGQ